MCGYIRKAVLGSNKLGLPKPVIGRYPFFSHILAAARGPRSPISPGPLPLISRREYGRPSAPDSLHDSGLTLCSKSHGQTFVHRGNGRQSVPSKSWQRVFSRLLILGPWPEEASRHCGFSESLRSTHRPPMRPFIVANYNSPCFGTDMAPVCYYDSLASRLVQGLGGCLSF